MAAALETFISKLVPKARETFESSVDVVSVTSSSEQIQVYVDTYKDAVWDSLPKILTELILMIVLLFIGKYLWNNYLVPVVSVLRPVESFLDILMIRILLVLLIPIASVASCCSKPLHSE